MSESFDIASLGPGWAPYTGQTLYKFNLVALRVPTEIGTRTIVGAVGMMVLAGDAQLTIELRSGAKPTYSVKHIVAWSR